MAISTQGYVVRKSSRKLGKRIQILVHREMMEAHLGRKLDKTEIVHHINGDKLDNRIENLQIMRQSEHARMHHSGRVNNPSLRQSILALHALGLSQSQIGRCVNLDQGSVCKHLKRSRG